MRSQTFKALTLCFITFRPTTNNEHVRIFILFAVYFFTIILRNIYTSAYANTLTMSKVTGASDSISGWYRSYIYYYIIFRRGVFCTLLFVHTEYTNSNSINIFTKIIFEMYVKWIHIILRGFLNSTKFTKV